MIGLGRFLFASYVVAFKGIKDGTFSKNRPGAETARLRE
jgi:hypothetical protein